MRPRFRYRSQRCHRCSYRCPRDRPLVCKACLTTSSSRTNRALSSDLVNPRHEFTSAVSCSSPSEGPSLVRGWAPSRLRLRSASNTVESRRREYRPAAMVSASRDSPSPVDQLPDACTKRDAPGCWLVWYAAAGERGSAFRPGSGGDSQRGLERLPDTYRTRARRRSRNGLRPGRLPLTRNWRTRRAHSVDRLGVAIPYGRTSQTVHQKERPLSVPRATGACACHAFLKWSWNSIVRFSSIDSTTLMGVRFCRTRRIQPAASRRPLRRRRPAAPPTAPPLALSSRAVSCRPPLGPRSPPLRCSRRAPGRQRPEPDRGRRACGLGEIPRLVRRPWGPHLLGRRA